MEEADICLFFPRLFSLLLTRNEKMSPSKESESVIRFSFVSVCVFV